MKQYIWPLATAFFLFSLVPLASRGEVGNDNPTGVTGEYNGSITTGGSYDPYTGNGKRFVTDLTVTGSVGAYPLKWTRILNTRGTPGSFGHGGTWRHSYDWAMWMKEEQEFQSDTQPYDGPIGGVSYPDGRVMDIDGNFTNPKPHGHEPGDLLVEAGNGNYDLLMQDGGPGEIPSPSRLGERL